MTLAEACIKLARMGALNNDFVFGEVDDPDNPTADELVELRSLINDGIRIIAQELRIWDPDVTLTIVAGQSTYSLDDLSVVSKRVIRPLKVTWDGTIIKGPGGYPGVYSLRELNRDIEKWRDKEASDDTAPIAAVYVGQATGNLMFVPAPWSGLTPPLPEVKIEGFVLPNPLTSANDAEELPLPFVLHDAVCWCAAEKGRKALATDQSVWISLAAYNKEWSDFVKKVSRETAAMIHGQTEDEYKNRGAWII